MVINKLIRKARKVISNPSIALDILINRTCSKWMPDIPYLKIRFKLNIGYFPNLQHPRTFNEKMTWIKLYDRRTIYTLMADKFAAKQYVRERIGDEYVVDTYAVVNSFDNIEWDKLPNQFVIKCTHDSSGVCICKDKASFDLDTARKKIEKSLKRNYYWNCREWPYKDIKPQVIVDKYLDDHTGKELLDYKFWCFNGEPTYMYCTIKGEGIFENFYDMSFNPTPINHGFPRHTPEFMKPSGFDLMKELATKLSEGIPFVRVDFFYVDGHIYFGEFTFFDWGGLRAFGSDWDYRLGRMIVLP